VECSEYIASAETYIFKLYKFNNISLPTARAYNDEKVPIKLVKLD